jgi:hypothetical protein
MILTVFRPSPSCSVKLQTALRGCRKTVRAAVATLTYKAGEQSHRFPALSVLQNHCPVSGGVLARPDCRVRWPTDSSTRIEFALKSMSLTRRAFGKREDLGLRLLCRQSSLIERGRVDRDALPPSIAFHPDCGPAALILLRLPSIDSFFVNKEPHHGGLTVNSDLCLRVFEKFERVRTITDSCNELRLVDALAVVPSPYKFIRKHCLRRCYVVLQLRPSEFFFRCFHFKYFFGLSQARNRLRTVTALKLNRKIGTKAWHMTCAATGIADSGCHPCC